MKLTIVLLIAACFQVSANGYAQKVTIKGNNISLQKVFEEIRKQTGYQFLYADEVLKNSTKVSLNIDQGSVTDVLNACLKGQHLGYVISENTIIIKREVITTKNVALVPLLPFQLFPQSFQTSGDLINKDEITGKLINATQMQINGKVVNSNGEPLIGVSVTLKGTTTGTSTDQNGIYSISAPDDNGFLIFSYVGFTAKEVPIDGRSQIDVTLEESVSSLEQVVVVGYGAQKKVSVVGAITTISGDAVERRGAVSNLASALSGQIGGVTVMETTGRPGFEDPQILIRGQSTWNGSQPLILVDGIERKMNDIDINDVGSISVLKDASATAVFGVKGANGVILITTKRGVTGKPRLSVGASMGIKSISKIPSLLDAYDAQLWKNAAIEHEVSVNENTWKNYVPYEQVLLSKRPQQYPDIYPNVDWQHEVLRNYAQNWKANMNLNGGTDFVKYFTSLAYVHEGDIFKTEYNDEKGYFPKYGFDRFNFRGNTDFKITKTTKLQTNINGYIRSRESPGLNGGKGAHIFESIYTLPPNLAPVRHSDGLYGEDPTTQLHNPVAELQEAGTLIESERHIGIDLNFDQDLDFITQGLSIGASASWDSYSQSTGPRIQDGLDVGNTTYKFISPSILEAKNFQDSLNAITIFYSPFMTPTNEFDFAPKPWSLYPETMDGSGLNRALFYQAKISYARGFGIHDVTGLFVFNRREQATGNEFTHYREDWVGRVTYNYDKRYLGEINGAYNGSEKFSWRNRFGFFPSIALGWMISQEQFMKGFAWLDELKIRGSWGKVGSDAGIPRWAYVSSWTTGGSSYFINPVTGTPMIRSPYPSFREGVIANPDLKWETAIKKNLGVEISILQGMFTSTLDLFKDRRDGIFMSGTQRNIPDFFGSAPVPANIGKTQSEGYELTLGFRKAEKPKMIGYWINVNLSSAKDKVLEREDPALMPLYQRAAGFQIGQTKSQIRTGFVNNWDEVYASIPYSIMAQKLPGDWDLVDYNGDGVLDNFDAVPFGYPQRPQNSYSLAIGLNYKGFSLMAQMFATTGITLPELKVEPAATRLAAVSEELNDFWTPQNTNAHFKTARLLTGSFNGDFSYRDGSYVRLKTVELAYDLPVNVCRRLGITNLRFYINGNNLLYWSDLSMDRETGSFVVMDSYPMMRTLNTGFNIGL